MSVKDSRNGETYRLDSARIIFRLISRVVLLFPCLESLEAVRDFRGSVTSALIKTVVAEREQLAKRIKDPKRLETPLLRAIRHVRDYYVTDVRDYPDDLVATRIARWTDKMKQLPHYKKLDAPHPAFLAMVYDMLRRAFDHIKQEIGFNRWKELARELPQEASTPLSIPFRIWLKGQYMEVDIPDNATPEQAAYLTLSAETKISPARLRKLVAEGHKVFPEKILQIIQQRWEKAYIDPKLNIIRVPLENEKEELVLDLSEADEHGITVKDLFEGLI